MANELNIALAKSGLTVTAQRYQSGAAVGSAISCPETGSTGFYSGNMTGAAGTYQVAFISASANVGSGSIVWSGSAEVPASTFNPAADTVATVTTLTNAPSVPSAASIRAEIDSNSTQLSAIKAKTDNLPASPAATGDIPSANITAIKAKTDAINVDRMNNTATLSQVGNLLAQANS